ncbi:MAG: hypothetical protein JOZ81_20550 [Chloroflexi bacterium]|nr:hypothetical protein [Chloroflexota bacterium]MBV9545162.1 hypothetical protein [Chloroflexota bacterium]
MTLDELVRRWSAQQQLTDAEALSVRKAILPTDSELEGEWLWDLLTPVTSLLDGPRSLSEMLGRAYGV